MRERHKVRHRMLAASATLAALLMVYATGTAPTLAQGPAPSPQDPHRFGALFVQCPGDTNGDAIPDLVNIDTDGVGGLDAYWEDDDKDGDVDLNDSPVRCMHLAAGDGMVTMADGKQVYTFGFSDVTGKLPAEIMTVGTLGANFPAPTIRLREREHFYLTLSNVGMVLRPDLFDAHSVHFHGFPQAAAVFDGVPESSTPIRMGSSFTYFYRIVEPGTYMYHCHVEATEHMQMGMLGNLYVEPKQNLGPAKTFQGKTYTKFAYNDVDGSTGYDVDYPLQLGSFDPNFHDMSLFVQPLPFAAMRDMYPMINGRGYPDTVKAGYNALNPPASPEMAPTATDLGPRFSQPVSSLITAKPGQRILLRISNLAVTRFYTLGSTIPMRVVGKDARLLRGPSGTSLYYTTNSVTVGGGESFDVIIDTTGLLANTTYALYATNLQYLSNDTQDYGGMMTEIRIVQ